MPRKSRDAERSDSEGGNFGIREVGPDARRVRKGSNKPTILSASGRPLFAFNDANGVPRAVGSGIANTIVYIHGIGNKPPASVLKCQWDRALFGAPLGDRSRMAYWVNRTFYPTPETATCASGDIVRIDDDEASTKVITALAASSSGEGLEVIRREIDALAGSDPVRREWLAALADQMLEKARADAPNDDGATAFAALDVAAKVLPLPPFLRKLLVESLTRALLRDVNDFLFVEKRRKAMEDALLQRLAPGGGPFVVVAHSLGSVIAYDVLRRLERSQVHVPLFVTIGSPLGMQEVQDAFAEWTDSDLSVPACVDQWVNVADRWDPVALDAELGSDFRGENITDYPVVNPDRPRHPHSATGYLSTEPVRTAIRAAVGSAFQQAIAPFAIARDLVSDMEDSRDDEPRSILIQLFESTSQQPIPSTSLVETAERVEQAIRTVVKEWRGEDADPKVERLRHFISAQLTRPEIETLRSHFKNLQIGGIWKNSAKRALINRSTHTVQARPANLGYGADGRNIRWAVLDTGIRADHPHFDRHSNVIAQWDCTGKGAPQEIPRNSRAFSELDRHGHGTHVAGIIAGQYEVAGELYAGMAPRAKLYGFKVLDDAGDGNDAWIIKGLDQIARMNEQAGALMVHGINLSLGGSFDPSVYGCGHTPLCQELRRLWRQGVVVCLAAGNEGYAVLNADGGTINANLDLSIGDPANLEETIAVGSVHKTNPHTYGISYFSSRGPTADGRCKPDLVAPGERVISARHDWQVAGEKADRYVEMSGTSMAAPHVSGVIAAFLSLRTEFVGYPDRVKEILLAACVDLKRDRNAQGAGLPNLIKMLALN